MDGKTNIKVEVEKPIAKPSFPLPIIFSSGLHAEMPTRKRSVQKRAHFFRRETTDGGTPIYDFYISDVEH